MKYWWLEKYHDFKIIQMNELTEDIHYFLTMPKNYEKKYQQIKEKNIDSLEEEELLILLEKIVDTKNIKDNRLNSNIDTLLQIPDNSFPASDYTLKQMLEEIKNLKENIPDKSKLENNNIAVCYHCLNVFYVDKIKNINKNNLCLCPYCLKTKLYFDNDYIPMNYTFIKLASIYYGISSLGCRFKQIQKIIQKSIITTTEKKEANSIDFSNIFSNYKRNPIDEKIIHRKLYQELMIQEKNLISQVTIYFSSLNPKERKSILEILLVSLLEVLSNMMYLKKIKINFEKEEDEKEFIFLFKTLKTFY